jgi:hypothetical protein
VQVGQMQDAHWFMTGGENGELDPAECEQVDLHASGVRQARTSDRDPDPKREPDGLGRAARP